MSVITFASLLGDQRLSETLSAEYLLMLSDREAMPQHESLIYAGDCQGKGSATIRLPIVGLMGVDLPTAVADGASVADSAFQDSSATVTIARYSKSYSATDLARLSDLTGIINATKFAEDAAVSHAIQLVSMIAQLVDGFSATQATSGTNLTFATHLAAVSQLEIANVKGPYIALYHPQQYADLRADLALAVSGGMQYSEATQEQLQVRGGQFKGRLAGSDIFTSSFVPTANAGADRSAGIWGRGAVVWADASIPAENDPNQIVVGNKVLFERDRNSRAGISSFISHSYLGVAFGINAAGVSVITDA